MDDLPATARAPSGSWRRLVSRGARGLWIGVFAVAFVVVGGVGLALFRALASGESLSWGWLGLEIVVAEDGAFEMTMRLASLIRLLLAGASLGAAAGVAATWMQRGRGEPSE